jgi:transcriptional regulator with XRE-family HTH domain
MTEEDQRWANRLLRLRKKLGVSQSAIGEVLGCDEFLTYKLESGGVRILHGRRLVVEVIERALDATGSVERVWGPRRLEPLERLARFFRLAFPGVDP